jgi:hypothetical protein
MEQWIKVHTEELSEGAKMDNSIIKKIIGNLYEMDNFVLSAYDNEGWLTYGVPDGEFEEQSREEAENNCDEHNWLVLDFDGTFLKDDYQEFIDTFKSVTRNKRDYDQAERDRIVGEATELINSVKDEPTVNTETNNDNGEIIMESPKYLTKEQVNDYLKKAKLNEQLMMEGPFDGLKQKMKDAHKAKDIKNSNKDSNVQRIIKDARDPEVSSTYTFIVDGKELPFNRAKGLSDEQLANAMVINRYGYYIRRGLQNVEKKHEFRHSSSQDWVKDEYKWGGKSAEEQPGGEEDPKKKKGKGKGKDEPQGTDETTDTPAEKLPPMKGDHRDWTYVLENGKAVNWNDLMKEKKTGKVNFDKITVYDKRKKKFTWEDANKVIEKQMVDYRAQRDANDRKKMDKQAAADKKAADKAANAEAKKQQKADDKVARDAIKNARDAEKVQKPVGRLKFFSKDGKEIGERQYKKLTTDEKKKYIAKDKKGNEFTYNDLLQHRKAQKRLNASLEQDPNKDILESLDWDAVGGNLNESLSRRGEGRDDTFTESYAKAKEDVEYDDDASSLDYLI